MYRTNKNQRYYKGKRTTKARGTRRYGNTRFRYGKGNKGNTPKYSGYSKPTTAIMRSPYGTIQPDRQFVKLKYSETVNVHETVIGPYEYVFRLNSIFDPDTSVGGHQPYGYDQYMSKYQKQRVLGSRITVRTFCRPDNTALSAQNAVRTLVVPSSYLSSLLTFYGTTDGRSIREIPRAKRSLASYNSKNPAYVSAYSDAGTPLGKTRKEVMIDPYFESDSGYDVATSHQDYWHIIVAPVDPESALLDCILEVDIEYYVLFTKSIIEEQS